MFLTLDEKPKLGEVVNEVKSEVELAIEDTKQRLEEEELIDIINKDDIGTCSNSFYLTLYFFITSIFCQVIYIKSKPHRRFSPKQEAAILLRSLWISPLRYSKRLDMK